MWELTDNSAAKWRGSAFSVELNTNHPEQGMKLLPGTEGSSVTAKPLQLFRVAAADQKRYAWKLQEAFVRGVDLVASYAPWPGDAVEPHFYWRHRSAQQHKFSGVEVIVSVHTSLLDSRPAISISGDLPSNGISKADLPDGMFLLTPTDSKRKVLLWIHPADFTQLEIQPASAMNGLAQWSTTLFSEASLEKGVIRRARLGFWSVPQETTEADFERLFEELTQEAPPLTT